MGQGYLAWGRSIDEWLEAFELRRPRTRTGALHARHHERPRRADEHAAGKSRGATQGVGNARRKSAQGARQLHRRSAQQPRLSRSGRPQCVQGGRGRLRQFRLGGVLQRTARSNPIHAEDAGRTRDSARVRIQPGEPFLSRRSHTRSQSVPETARRRHPGVRRQLAQSDREATQLGPRYVCRRCHPGGCRSRAKSAVSRK